MTTISGTKIRTRAAGQAVTTRLALGVALSGLSGLMLLLAFPPYGLWPLAWFALVPGLLAQYRVMPAKWTSLAPAIYFGLWLGPFLARLFGPMGIFFQYLGVWIAILELFTAKDRRFHELTRYRWFIFQGMIMWVGFEMIRATFIPIVATTAFIGYTQATQPWLIQPVSIFSVYGLNMVIILFNYALAQGVMAWLDRRWAPEDVTPVDPRTTRRWIGAVGILLVAWIGISLLILNSFPEDDSTVRVASIRPNYPVPAHQDTANTSEVRLARFTEQAREAAAQGAQVIYTPEMMFNFDPQLTFTGELRSLAKETGAYLFLSYTYNEGDDWRNEAVLLSPEGEFSQVYGKFHTWMIGERPTPSAGEFPVFETPLGRLATLICHDANYTDVSRWLAGNGAQIISTPFREFGGFGEQAWQNALFRAVENRVAVVVSGVATVTGIVNPDGSIVDLDTDIDGSQLTMVGDVQVGTGGAPYTSLGDVLGWGSLAGYAFFLIYPSVVSRRKKKA